MYNNLGQLVLNKEFMVQPGAVTEELSMQDLQEGVYFIIINTKDRIERRKIIKD